MRSLQRGLEAQGKGVTAVSYAQPCMDAIDRAIVMATQGGLPLTIRPYQTVADRIGVSEQEVMARIRAMAKDGRLRRIGVVPNHYALGYSANAMSVWDVVDERLGEVGRQIGKLSFVSHCYRRPRHLPEWPYNLFVMLHGRKRDQVQEQADSIRTLLSSDCRSYELLYSTRILKKTGLRLKK